MQPDRIAQLEEAVTKMRTELDSLMGSYYKNNFNSSQTFNKDVVFNTRLKVPSYSTAPSVSEVGDLIEVGGVLYICTVAGGTFTAVGTQS